MVSPWAARCSQCGHSCDDADELAEEAVNDDLPAVEESEVNWSPDPTSLHQSPPRDVIGRDRRWSRTPVLLLAAALMVVTGLTIANVATVRATSTGATPEAWIAGLRGTIVAQAFTGALVASAPDGAHRRGFTVLPFSSGQFPQYVAAPDGRLLLHTTGYSSPPRSWRIINVSSDPLAAHDAAALEALHSTALTQTAPFADHDQAIVVVPQGLPGPQSNASIVALAGGRTLAIGRADAAAGDPQSFGAFVSPPINVAPTSPVGSSDASIQLRDAGQPPITLASAGHLNEVVGQASATSVDLRVYPDPTGDKLAVLLNPPGASAANVPMVILNRQGEVLSFLPQAAGPTADTQPAWSPDGRLVAYPTDTPTGRALVIETLNAQLDLYPVSNRNTQLGSCVWAPTAITVVCLARTGLQTAWEFANRATGTLNRVKSRGYPVVWLPPPDADLQDPKPAA